LTVFLESAGAPRRLSARADADKARAGALGGPLYGARSAGTSDDQTQEARDPNLVRVSPASPFPHRLEVPLLGAEKGLPRGFSTVSTRGQADAQGGQGLRTERWRRRQSCHLENGHQPLTVPWPELHRCLSAGQRSRSRSEAPVRLSEPTPARELRRPLAVSASLEQAGLRGTTDRHGTPEEKGRREPDSARTGGSPAFRASAFGTAPIPTLAEGVLLAFGLPGSGRLTTGRVLRGQCG
jgi:hypothetical protein